MRLFGGIEAGGTKFVCAVGSGPNDLRAEIRFPTASPEETLGRAIAFFGEHHARTPLDAIGIASFGPIDPNTKSPTWGFVTTTPKPGWAHIDFAGTMGRALGLPVGFDTDVNGAALGEGRWGAAQGLDTFVYLTVGTGVGGGAVVNGKLLHGLMHPEMGHTRVPHDWNKDPYSGNCPYHGDCLEGLTCGPAMAERWGQVAETLPPDHPAWTLEAHYLGMAVANLTLTVCPQRVILGGGVMQQPQLLTMIRQQVIQTLNGYVQAPALDMIEDYVVAPALGNQAGVLGAIALAELASA